MTAWAKTRDPRSPEKAEEMIKLMEKMFSEDSKQGINSNLAPHGQTYTVSCRLRVSFTIGNGSHN